MQPKIAQKTRGILLPFTTPFKSNEEIDHEGLRTNIQKWNATGVKGYIALGSTGERVHLSEYECLQVIDTARQEVPNSLLLIVGVGQQSTRGSIQEIKQAAAAGADAVLVLTPHFYRPAMTQAALVSHFNAVADSSPLPVLLYSMPALTGIKIDPATVARLSEHENIVGIKDSSTDIESLRRTVAVVPESFAVLTGNGTVLSEALTAGAFGGILAVGCIAAKTCIAIFHAVQSSELNRSMILQERLTPLARAVTTVYGIGGLKAALDMVGYAGGSVRLPLTGPDEQARQEISSLLVNGE